MPDYSQMAKWLLGNWDAPARAYNAQSPTADFGSGLLGNFLTKAHQAIDPVNGMGGYGGLLAMALPMGGPELPLTGGFAKPRPSIANKLGELGYNQEVYHGSQASDLTEPGAKLKARTGGLKLMDGLGPHTGTAEAATARLNSYHGVKASKVNLDPKLSGSYVLPAQAKIQKPFTRKDGSPYTESELQQRLADIGEKLGYSRSDLRHYSSRYAPPAKFREAQKAIRQHLLDQGYDSIPYINAHEARGSTSWVHLKPNTVASKLTGEMLFNVGGAVSLGALLERVLNSQNNNDAPAS